MKVLVNFKSESRSTVRRLSGNPSPMYLKTGAIRKANLVVKYNAKKDEIRFSFKGLNARLPSVLTNPVWSMTFTIGFKKFSAGTFEGSEAMGISARNIGLMFKSYGVKVPNSLPEDIISAMRKKTLSLLTKYNGVALSVDTKYAPKKK